MSSRAIHLELLSDQSTPIFLLSLDRLIARRGKPERMYSDQGTNFEGARNELKRLYNQAISTYQDKEVQNYLSKLGIKWIMNPPASPHHGGVWEICVKLTKKHLRKVMSETTLTFEEFSTLLCKIESLVNSRPLTPMSSDPEDEEALTPGHFLIGSSLVSNPHPSLEHLKINTLSKYQLIQRRTQEFWKRWTTEYLSHLQPRPKWNQLKRNFEVGDLCIVREDFQPSHKWKLGRIVKTLPGKDGVVRVVEVKTKERVYTRPITKLSYLPSDIDPTLSLA